MTQLVELQQRYGDYQSAKVAVFAVSYDSVDILKAFAEKRAIDYPLLSDEGSRAITELGLLNEYVNEHYASLGREVPPHVPGVPYPGTFVLDEAGIVVEKDFEQGHRIRPVSPLSAQQLGLATKPAAEATAAGQGVTVTAWLETAAYRPHQKLFVEISMQVEAGLHIYAPGAPEGFHGLRLELDGPDDLTVREIAFPESSPFKVQGIEQTFAVYEGELRTRIPFIVGKNHGSGELKLGVGFQACSDTVCFPPEELTLRLPIEGHDLISPRD